MATYALIPARSGSKGLPGKNMRMLAGKALIDHTILTAISCRQFDGIYVSSDSTAILEHCAEVGSSTILRPDHLALDETAMDPVIAHWISNLPDEKADHTLVLLQPTSPLRQTRHLEEAIQLFNKSRNPVYSVCKSSHSPFKCFSVDQAGFLSGHFGVDAPFSRRQDFPETYFANGAIYIFSKSSFMQNLKIPRKSIVPYFMDEMSSLDIDNEEDLQIADNLMRKILG